MRMGKWKMHFPHRYRSLEGRPGGNNGIPTKYNYGITTDLVLYDLEADPFEKNDVKSQNPGIVVEMSARATAMRAKLGDRLSKIKGTDVRAPGRISVENNR